MTTMVMIFAVAGVVAVGVAVDAFAVQVVVVARDCRQVYLVVSAF